MSTPTTHRTPRTHDLGDECIVVAQRGAPDSRPLTEPVLRVITRDEYRCMTIQRTEDPLLTTMRLVGGVAQLLFSGQDPERANTLALELARTSSPCKGLDDPVRTWDSPLQVDRGLGRARRVQRLVNSPVWQSDRNSLRNGKAPNESTADYLFATVMNLKHRMPLSDAAHVFRLWYLATRAVNPPDNATRLFGDLRALAEHQQLAAGERVLQTMGIAAAHGPSSRPRLPLQRTAVLRAGS